MEDGNVASWGHNRYKQISVPGELTNDSVDVKNIYTGYYQNYAVDNNGEIHTWGLKGFCWEPMTSAVISLPVW